jgi:hypothetical protein
MIIQTKINGVVFDLEVDSVTLPQKYTRHGGAFDRGSADAYYGRPYSPHYYAGDTGSSERVEFNEMTPEERGAYDFGYTTETDRKD